MAEPVGSIREFSYIEEGNIDCDKPRHNNNNNTGMIITNNNNNTGPDHDGDGVINIHCCLIKFNKVIKWICSCVLFICVTITR